MNKHFEDAGYYLKRAAETAKRGVAAELEPLRERYEELVGEEEAPDSGRFDRLREDLEAVEERAEGEAREAIEHARERLREYRVGARHDNA